MTSQSDTVIDMENVPPTEVAATGGRYPYIDHIGRLAQTDPDYVFLSRFLQDKIAVQESNDVAQGPVENESQSGILTKAPKPDEAWIFDFHDDKVLIQHFPKLESQSGFHEALKVMGEGKTRLILIDSQMSGAHGPAGYEEWLPCFEPALIDTLGGTYNISPAFFDSMISAKERDKWARATIVRELSARHPSGAIPSVDAQHARFVAQTYHDIARLQSHGFAFGSAEYPSREMHDSERCLTLGFEHDIIPIWREPQKAARLWAAFAEGVYNSAGFKALIVRCYSGKETIMTKGDELLELPKIAPTLSSKSAITYLSNITPAQLIALNQDHIRILEPFLAILENHFRIQLLALRTTHDRWMSKSLGLSAATLARYDAILSYRWRIGRCAIEDYSAIFSRLEEFQAFNSDIGTITQIFQTRQNNLLAKARLLETHVRDTIQLNIGNLALQESRKSIQQANTVGRVSFLAFVFIPLSLATSFFGMNISELTGSGASWKTFVISTVCLCALVLLVCAWLWRKSRRLKFVVYSPLAAIAKLVLLLSSYTVWDSSPLLVSLENFLRSWSHMRIFWMKEYRQRK